MVITWKDFEKVELRVGTVIKADVFKKAHKPAYILHIDLGEIGIKKSSSQITNLYTLKELIGKQVICVINFEPKQIGPIHSEILVTGFSNAEGHIVLASVEQPMTNGSKLI